MEITIGLLLTGLFILLVTVYRIRKVVAHRQLQHELRESYDVSGLDLSGNTRYASCFSHSWVMDNITRKSHSRIGAKLQEYLANNTLFAGIWIGLVVGLSSMFLTFLFVQSLRTIGTVIIIFAVGALIALGPGGPRYAENLLDAVRKSEIEDLNAQDFVYVKIANDTIARSILINMILASLFIILAPWGEMLPGLFAQAIALFSAGLLWDPALVLMQYNLGIALFYIAAIVGLSSFVCYRIGQRLLMAEEEAPRTQY
ncbi:MAG: hypothetical protein ACFFE2_09130 [Candidatus Thorarchaeota archaeon]